MASRRDGTISPARRSQASAIDNFVRRKTMLLRIARAIRGTLAAVAILLAAALAAQAQGHWTKAAAFPEPMEETHAVAANGKLYVMGGFVPPGIAPGIVYEYDPASDHW